MKNILFVVLIITSTTSLFGQQNITFGAGYFGETLLHPGLFVQAEYSKPLNDKISVPFRADVGYYMHKQNHQAIFTEVVTGFRWHIGSRFYAGINGGVGLMFSGHHSDDGVYEVGENGNVSQVSSYAGTDFMPSVGLEFAYQIKKGDSMSNYIFLRPKGFWQMNVNEKALFHYALEVGYTFSINARK